MNKLVICVGLGRSGSTLQFNVARRLLARSGPLDDRDYTENGAEISRLIRKFDGSRNAIVKTHCHFDFFRPAADLPFVRFLCCVRDFREVCTSYMTAYGMSFDYLMRRKIVERDMTTYASVRGLKPLLMQRYPVFVRQLPEAIREMAEFLEIPLGPADAVSIAGDFSRESQVARINAYNRTFRSKAIRAINAVFNALNPTGCRPNGLFLNRDPKSGLHWNHIESSGNRVPAPPLTPDQCAELERLLSRVESSVAGG